MKVPYDSCARQSDLFYAESRLQKRIVDLEERIKQLEESIKLAPAKEGEK